MKKYLSALILTLMFLPGFAQVKTVTLDYQNGIFNESQPLPAGTHFTVKGAVNSSISVVTIAIFKNRRRFDTLYTAEWNRPIGSTTNSFVLPVNYKLRGNSQYDIVLLFYSALDDSARMRLAKRLHDNLEAYIQSAISVSPRKISLRSPVNTAVSDMNQIVWSAFTYYKNILPGAFPGFSDLVKNKLKQLNNEKITHARLKVENEAGQKKMQVRQQYIEESQQQLVQTAMGEVEPYINGRLAVLEDVREKKQYPTEETSRSLALNVGYGGVYLSGEWKDMDYEAAPYAGISFPLGNKRFSSFWGNTSVSLGVFLRNFKDKEGNKLTGPVVGLPYYLGLGYKFLHVFRLQVGMVATSTEEVNNIQDVKTEDFKLKPFVGVSAEINLWLGFDKKR